MNRLTELGPRIVELMQGPASLRFILQPILAILVGIYGGLLDAKAGVQPYGARLVTAHGGERRGVMKEGVKRVAIPLTIAFLVDAVVSFQLFHTVFPLQSLLIGTLLVFLPYAVARAFTNRIRTALIHRHREKPAH